MRLEGISAGERKTVLAEHTQCQADQTVLKFVHGYAAGGQLGEALFPGPPYSLWKPQTRPHLHQDGTVDVAAYLLGIARLAQHPLVDDATIRVGPQVVASPGVPSRW